MKVFIDRRKNHEFPCIRVRECRCTVRFSGGEQIVTQLQIQQWLRQRGSGIHKRGQIDLPLFRRHEGVKFRTQLGFILLPFRKGQSLRFSADQCCEIVLDGAVHGIS